MALSLWLWTTGCMSQKGVMRSSADAMDSMMSTRALPDERQQAEAEVDRLQRWIQQRRRVAGLPRRSRQSQMENGKPPRRIDRRPGKAMQDEPTNAAPRRPDRARPTARRYRRRRMSPCQRMCRASRSICLAATRICRIAHRFPNVASFRSACTSGKHDCEDAQNRCRACR